MSHKKAWENASTPALICEDDINIIHNFDSKLEDVMKE
jgi:GR25 family glycosyltransferase involved in LPS biosynthesis